MLNYKNTISNHLDRISCIPLTLARIRTTFFVEQYLEGQWKWNGEFLGGYRHNVIIYTIIIIDNVDLCSKLCQDRTTTFCSFCDTDLATQTLTVTHSATIEAIRLYYKYITLFFIPVAYSDQDIKIRK